MGVVPSSQGPNQANTSCPRATMASGAVSAAGGVTAVSCLIVSGPSDLILTVRQLRERVIVAALFSCGIVLEYRRRSRVEELLLSVAVGLLVLLHLLPFLPFSLL